YLVPRLYNTLRPHSSLGYRPPAPLAVQLGVTDRSKQQRGIETWKPLRAFHISTPPTPTSNKRRNRRYTNNPSGTKHRSGHLSFVQHQFHSGAPQDIQSRKCHRRIVIIPRGLSRSCVRSQHHHIVYASPGLPFHQRS